MTKDGGIGCRVSVEIAIVGAGPAGLIAAELLVLDGHRVTVYERMPSPGRRFLMAGIGGLNLTHSEDHATFKARYGEGAEWLAPLIDRFPPSELRSWADGLGAQTFVGSSGRVFPAAMKASPLLRRWLARLEGEGVRFAFRHDWTGWTGAALCFETPDGSVRVRPYATLLALGGATWTRLGADGSWQQAFRHAAIPVSPLRPANAALHIGWSEHLRNRFAGAPLKNIALRDGDVTLRGEVIVTREGLEGGVAYAISNRLRDRVAQDVGIPVSLDLKPDLSVERLAARLGASRRGESMSNRLRKASRLSPVAIGLLREAPFPAVPAALAARIKEVPLLVTGIGGMERAISTAGGVARAALDENLMLRARPGTFVAGEMLDWEAPTGGYLLQASFATGIAAARGLLAYLSRNA